jgi:hypothetical protein
MTTAPPLPTPDLLKLKAELAILKRLAISLTKQADHLERAINQLLPPPATHTIDA